MSELTYLLLRIGFLALLWIFVFIAIFAIRSELFGPKVRALPKSKEPTPAPDMASLIVSDTTAPAVAPTPTPAPEPTPSRPRRAPINDPADLFLDLDAEDDSESPTTLTPLVGTDTAPGRIVESGSQLHAPSQLAVVDGPSAGVSIHLGNDPITIGRAADCGLRISDDYTSSYHARLFKSGGRWMIEDTGSTNGTKLAGYPVHQPTPVDLGQPIQIGTNVLELRG